MAETDPAPARPSLFERRPRLMASIVLAGAIFMSLTLFLAGDYLYTLLVSAVVRPTDAENCMVRDPIRYRAYRPDCAGIVRWGPTVHPVYTNDLGMRDRAVRTVPREDTRPRILLLGDSFTDGAVAWPDSYAGMIAAHFPEYDFLNGGVTGYGPSDYLNVARNVLAKGYRVDEVLAFVDISDVQNEAAYYRDVDATGAVTGPARERNVVTFYSRWREQIARHFVLTNAIFRAVERLYVRLGLYDLDSYTNGNVFDMERSAWTYRKVRDDLPYPAGYAPLGMKGGLEKSLNKMSALRRELAARHIPLGIVVFPWPAQILHDGPEPMEERVWRDWCHGDCKRFISLYPAFRARAAQCPADEPGCWYERYFIFGDIHYNARGNAVVAQAVIASLAADPPKKAAP